MPAVKLLSNGKYHLFVSAEGSGQSQWNDLATTRRRRDAALGGFASIPYLHPGDALGPASVGVQPTSSPSARFLTPRHVRSFPCNWE